MALPRPRFLRFFLLSLGLLLIGIVGLFGYRDIPLAELKAKYAPEPSAFRSVDGMEVHHRDEGPASDSIPIVLIHGTGSSLHTFDEWTAELVEAGHRVVRMDLPGYGLTGPFPQRDYRISQYVSFLDHFLTTIGISRCVLVGNSLGGEIAWHFTAAHPEQVSRLVLIDAAGYPFTSQSVPLAFQVAKTPVLKQLLTFITPRFIARSSVENVYADKSKVSDELADRYFELTLRAGNRQAFVDRFAAPRDSNAYRKVQEILTPTLILWGEADQLIPVELAYRFQADLPNDTLVILPGVGHVPMEESPLQSLEPVLGWLAKERGTER